MNATNKIALITGANKGIGLETARQLARLGVHVILTARDAKKGQDALRQLQSEGLTSEFVQLDVTQTTQIQAVARYLEAQYGQLDILVNNAGVSREKAVTAWVNTSATVSLEVLRETYETNLFGVIALTQALLPLLAKSPAGRIVNVSSMMGSLTLHADASSPIYHIKKMAYNSSKTALNQFTVHLAETLAATNVMVNSANPGWVKTDLGGAYAPLSVEEGAMTVVELATLPAGGPHGAFLQRGVSIPW
jgi:NAD(P)-dependent dehydrogenase (short-subunit alcohol dehydrogenase family)